MVNVDGPPAQLRAQLIGENLHVAREYHELGARGVDELHEPPFLRQLVGGGHRQVEERQVVPVRGRLECRMVGDHRRDVHLQLAGAVTVQQVLEAVIEVRHHDEDAGALAAVVDAPLELFGRRDRLELAPQAREVDGLALHPAEGDAYEKTLRDRVIELVHFHEIEAPRREKSGDGCGGAHAARAARGEHVGSIGGK